MLTQLEYYIALKVGNLKCSPFLITGAVLDSRRPHSIERSNSRSQAQNEAGDKLPYN